MADKRSRSASHYIGRLFEDEYVQDQLREASRGLVSLYGRVHRKGAKAPEDKKVYGSLRQAATSIRNLVLAFRRPVPEPQPKHRVRRVAIALALIGASVLVIKRGPQTAAPSIPPETDDGAVTGLAEEPDIPDTQTANAAGGND